MLRKLFGNHDDSEELTWSTLRVPKGQRDVYKYLANLLRVPVSVLLRYVQDEWLAANCQTLMANREKRAELGKRVAEKYMPHDREYGA